MARAARGIAVAVPVAFLGVFFVWPLVAILLRGIGEGTALTSMEQARLARVAWFTLWQATASTVLTVAAGQAGAWTLARFRIPGGQVVRAAVLVPFVLPTVVVGTAFVALLGRSGPLASLGLHPGVVAILLAHVFFNYAVVVRTVGGTLDQLDPRLEEAARVLGAGAWRAAREVTIPLLRPAIAASTAIVFLFTFTSFGVVLILGGATRSTLEVEIWRQTAQLLDLRTAAVLALVQLLFVVAALSVHSRLTRRVAGGLRQRARREVARRPSTTGERLFVTANLVVMAALIGAPIATLVLRSLQPGGEWSLQAYRALSDAGRRSALFVPPVEAITNSLVFATATVVLAVAVGGLAAAAIHARWRGALLMDRLLMLPLGTSAVTLGFGFLIALDRPPVDLRTSVALIPIAHSLVAIPFVVRTVVPALASLPEELREAAAVLGATPARVRWEVDAPIVSRAAAVGAGLTFAVSLGEFGATIFVARPDRPTVPIAIFRLLSQPGSANFAQAMALSTVLMVLTAAAVLGIERLRPGASDGF